MKRTYCFDLDNTLCERVSSVEEYPHAKPFPEMIAFVNKLHAQGQIIYLYTGRHTQHAVMTTKWLKLNGVKYHHLFLGKPVADVYIDDLALRHTSLAETKKGLKKLKLLPGGKDE